MKNGPCGGRESGGTHRAAPAQLKEVPCGTGETGGDRAPPLHVYRKSMQWADVGIGPYGVRGTGDEG